MTVSKDFPTHLLLLMMTTRQPCMSIRLSTAELAAACSAQATNTAVSTPGLLV